MVSAAGILDNAVYLVAACFLFLEPAVNSEWNQVSSSLSALRLCRYAFAHGGAAVRLADYGKTRIHLLPLWETGRGGRGLLVETRRAAGISSGSSPVLFSAPVLPPSGTAADRGDGMVPKGSSGWSFLC